MPELSVLSREERRSVHIFLISRTLASVGAVALTVALGKQVFDLTHRELDLGFLGLAEFSPSLVLLLLTGALADRVDRRRLVAIGVFGQAASVAVLGWYATTDPTSAVPIFVLVVLFGCARAFTMPAGRALPADMVPPDRMPWITVRGSAIFQISSIAGPVIGGFLYAVDVAVPFAVVAVLLAVSACLMLTVRLRVDGADRTERALPTVGGTADSPADTPSAAAPNRWHEAFEGLRFIRHQPALLGAISLDLFAVLFGGAVALLPAIAEERLGVGAGGLGLLRAAYGIGAAVTTAGIAIRPIHRRVGPIMFASVGVFGLATIVLGLTRSFVVAFIALAVLSGADAVSVFIRSTFVPLITPVDKRGRVLAVEMIFVGASNELGGFESGVTGQLMGTTGAVVLGGACTLAVTVGWTAMFPSLRNLDRFPGMEMRSEIQTT